jgi:hypothetical protein
MKTPFENPTGTVGKDYHRKYISSKLYNNKDVLPWIFMEI